MLLLLALIVVELGARAGLGDRSRDSRQHGDALTDALIGFALGMFSAHAARDVPCAQAAPRQARGDGDRRTALLRSAGGRRAAVRSGGAAQPRADRRSAARMAAGRAAWCSKSPAAPASMRSYFAERFPQLEWQPSDMHPDALASIARLARSSRAAEPQRADRHRRRFARLADRAAPTRCSASTWSTSARGPRRWG